MSVLVCGQDGELSRRVKFERPQSFRRLRAEQVGENVERA
jgi:hypothetical protein